MPKSHGRIVCHKCHQIITPKETERHWIGRNWCRNCNKLNSDQAKEGESAEE